MHRTLQGTDRAAFSVVLQAARVLVLACTVVDGDEARNVLVKTLVHALIALLARDASLPGGADDATLADVGEILLGLSKGSLAAAFTQLVPTLNASDRGLLTAALQRAVKGAQGGSGGTAGGSSSTTVAAARIAAPKQSSIKLTLFK